MTLDGDRPFPVTDVDEDAPTAPLEPPPIEPPPIEAPPIQPTPVAGPVPPPVVGARQLFGTSFDLLLHVGHALRPASFYVGLVVLGTLGPTVLAFLALASVVDLDAVFEAILVESGPPRPDLPISSGSVAWLVLLVLVAFAGFVVASIESTGLAIAVLGGHLGGRPVTTREAVQRSRMVFWLLVAATLLINVPTGIVQNVINGIWLTSPTTSAVIGLAAAVVIQAPFVYANAGIVLGGVGPIEAFRRSIRVFAARKVAGLAVTLFPVLFQFVLLFGFNVGLDVIGRIVTVLGLDAQGGAAELAVLAMLAVMLTFSIGTLLLTAAALSVAPQVVMFVSLTHATMGLDAVRPGGSHSVQRWGDGHAPFRWLTRPMLAGFVLGGVSLAAFLATFEV